MLRCESMGFVFLVMIVFMAGCTRARSTPVSPKPTSTVLATSSPEVIVPSPKATGQKKVERTVDVGDSSARAKAVIEIEGSSSVHLRVRSEANSGGKVQEQE